MLRKLSPISVLAYKNWTTDSLVLGSVFVSSGNWTLHVLTIQQETDEQDGLSYPHFLVRDSSARLEMVCAKSTNLTDHEFLGFGAMLPDLWNKPPPGADGSRYCCIFEGGRKLAHGPRITYLV